MDEMDEAGRRIGRTLAVVLAEQDEETRAAIRKLFDFWQWEREL